MSGAQASSDWLRADERHGSLVTVGLGCVSGLLFTLSIPRADLDGLAWICLVPCFVALHRRQPDGVPQRWRRALALGLAFGVTSGVGRVYWIAETLTNYGNLSWGAAILTNAALVLYLAAYPVCFFLLTSRFLRQEAPTSAWLSACLWVLLEWAQSWIITGFPWELLGYSQYRNLALLQTVSLTGIYGVSFLVVVVNASLAQALMSRRRLLPNLGPAAFLLALAMTLGHIRLQDLEAAALEEGDRLRVGIVQGNVPQGEKWTAGRTQRSVDRYVDLTRRLVEESSGGLDLIIFPETALPFTLNHPAHARQYARMTSLAMEMEVPLLVGALARTAPGSLPLNRAYLLSTAGEVIGHYDKVHLVPFGEYLPLPWLFQYMGGLTAESGAFEEGNGFVSLPLPRDDGDSLPFGVFICYESVFPEITRALVRAGARVVINTTNDAWFGDTAAPYQHLSMAVVRAVETGRPLLRAANTGISAVVRPTGEIVQATPLFETTAISATVVPRSEMTPYVQYGDLFVAMCGLFIVSAAAIALNRHRGPPAIAAAPPR